MVISALPGNPNAVSMPKLSLGIIALRICRFRVLRVHYLVVVGTFASQTLGVTAGSLPGSCCKTSSGCAPYH
jgi:hypothetical protein